MLACYQSHSSICLLLLFLLDIYHGHRARAQALAELLVELASRAMYYQHVLASHHELDIGSPRVQRVWMNEQVPRVLELPHEPDPIAQGDPLEIAALSRLRIAEIQVREKVQPRVGFLDRDDGLEERG